MESKVAKCHGPSGRHELVGALAIFEVSHSLVALREKRHGSGAYKAWLVRGESVEDIE